MQFVDFIESKFLENWFAIKKYIVSVFVLFVPVLNRSLFCGTCDQTIPKFI